MSAATLDETKPMLSTLLQMNSEDADALDTEQREELATKLKALADYFQRVPNSQTKRKLEDIICEDKKAKPPATMSKRKITKQPRGDNLIQLMDVATQVVDSSKV